MKAQYYYWIGAALALLVAVIAGIADARRHKRDRLDEIGWVPWRGIQVVAFFAIVLALFLGLRAG